MLALVQTMKNDESNQRAGFQFELIKLNLLTNGAIIAFALNKPNDWYDALLACPLISFLFFSLWFHHALAIRLAPDNISHITRLQKHTLAQRLRRWTFAISILGNFVLVPTVAMLLYFFKKFSWLIWFGCVLLVIILVLFGFWFKLQYFQEGIPEESANNANTADAKKQHG